jgi:hypothetical protein
MPMEHFLSLFHQSSGRGSKSTALQPLGWLVAMIGFILASSLAYKAANWILIVVASAFAISVFVYVCSYIYLIMNNIDATRSERFTLEKIALQQSRTGDDRTGFIEAADRQHTLPLLQASASDGSEKDSE